jgi:hypothetical protein
MTMSKATQAAHGHCKDPAKDAGPEYELGLRKHEIRILKETAEAFSSQLHLDKLFQLVAERGPRQQLRALQLQGRLRQACR